MKTYLCHLMSGFFGSTLSVQDSSILLYIGSVCSLSLVYNSLLYKYTKIYSSTPNGYLGRARFGAVMNNSYKHSSTWLLSSFLLGIYLERKAFSHSECTCSSWVDTNSFPEQLHKYLLSPAMYESFSCSPSLPTIDIFKNPFNFSHSDDFIPKPYFGFVQTAQEAHRCLLFLGSNVA